MRAGNKVKGFIIYLAIFGLVAGVLYFDSVAKADATEIKIAATIFPLANIASHIVGEKGKVITILPAGANPHTFELTPQEIKELGGVRMIFAIGHGLDDWVKRTGESLPQARTVIVDQSIALVHTNEEDPHYWVSIVNVKIIAGNIARALADVDPARKNEYEANLGLYSVRLDEADRNIRKLLSDLPARKIVTFHDGWRYFARDYDLEVVGNVESSHGSEPTPKRLARLGGIIREQKIKVLFSEPAVSKTVAESLAKDFKLHVYELDPFGDSKPKQDFIDLMTANARIIHEALNHG